MSKIKQLLANSGEFVLVLICCYLIAVLFTLLAVALGGISSADTSVWSEHIRSIAGYILK